MLGSCTDTDTPESRQLNDLVGFVVTLVAIIVSRSAFSLLLDRIPKEPAADFYGQISERSEFPQDLSFGWQRARLLGAFFNGAFLLALGVSILLQSAERFISVREVEDVKLVLIMGAVGLFLNIVSAAFLHGECLMLLGLSLHDETDEDGLEHHHHHGHHHHPPKNHDPDPEQEISSGSEGEFVTASQTGAPN